MSDEIELPGELPFPTDPRDLPAAPPAPGVLSGAPRSTGTPTGWCPFATRHATPNFWRGHTDRAAVVDHVTEAGWASVVSWFKNPASQRSAHFQVRQNGDIDQFVSIEDSAWANGASWQGDHWIDPQGHVIHPPWPLMTPPVNPNRRTISKEHEGNTRTPWTAAQKAADTKLNRWLATQYPSLAPYVAGHTLIRHGDISPVTKPNCPGPLVNLVERAAAANGAMPTPTPKPPVVVMYMATHTQAVFESPTPDGKIALNGQAELGAGTAIGIDEVKNGWAHLANHVGFVPVGVLEKL